MDIYSYCESKESHCRHTYRLDANISSYLWNETVSRDCYQKLIQLINASSTPVDLYWGLQSCTYDSNTA